MHSRALTRSLTHIFKSQAFSSVFNRAYATRSTAGIVAMDVYFPSHYVEQKDLEAFDQVGEGKYTKGLGQNRMAFVDSDREDTASMCMTVFHNLLEKYNIDPKQIGRLEVGTETPIDKSKSIKSYLMTVLEKYGHTNIEGIDNIHACYGGTSALLNAMYYLEHQKVVNPSNPKYALVVCGDISNYKEKASRPSGGAGVIAMLLSANDAPIQIDLTKKASHFEHVYDFYKPDPTSPFPVVDGHYSNVCYLRSLDNCYDRFKEASNGKGLANYDFTLFHSPYNKLVQKSLARLIYKDTVAEGKIPSYIPPSVAQQVDEAKLKQSLSTPVENSYNDKEIEKTFGTLSADVYKQKVEKTHLLSKELGNCYTASLYIGLASLVFNEGKNLSGKDILMFSYGSGLASSMFEVNVSQQGETPDGKYSLQKMQQVLDLKNRLAARRQASVEDYARVVDNNVKRYTQNERTSSVPIDYLAKGAYYLTHVDQMWRRKYERKQ
jgi:hydroxymethylglutaryl-CoA synthase